MLILTWVYRILLLISLIYYSAPFEEDLWLSFQVALKELQIAEMPTNDKLPQIHGIDRAWVTQLS